MVTTSPGPFADEFGDCYRAMAASVPVVAVSHHQAATARRTPIAAVIHHGIDVEAIPEGDGDGGYALFLGRMSPDKGVHTAARVARAGGTPLTIASRIQGPTEHDYYRGAVESLLGDDVAYVGEVGGAAKSELIGRTSCLLNSLAWTEPFGMVMIEALAQGTPVVATPGGSVPELIDDGVTGFVRSSDVYLALTLRAVPTLDRSRCRQAAAKRFSTRRMVADHLAMYERIVAERHPRRAA